MRIIFCFIASAIIISCNNSSKTKEDIKDTANKVSQMQTKTILPDTIFTGLGTEPFWAVYVIKDSKIVFHPADGADVEVPFVAVPIIDNIATYNSSTGEASIELIITRIECSDGMSDKVYPYQVNLTVNKIKYDGCGTYQ